MVRKEIFHNKYTYVELHIDPSICQDILILSNRAG